ncbi:MAG: permease [Bacteroides sp.]|nr:permease [Bacteroides sp.]
MNSLLFMLNEMSPYILLGFLIAGVMHAFVPQQTFARHLSGTGFKAVVKSALIGIPLPLCSCGVLPTAIAMRRNGASRAASTAFLVATPQTGIDSIAATWSLLGPAFALIRPIAALVTAILGGVAVGKTEKEDAAGVPAAEKEAEAPDGRSWKEKCLDALRYGYIDLVGSIGGWLVTGLIVAALITVYVPADFFSVLGSRPIFSMIAVLIIAVPMYVCATGSIPIAMSLMLKGLSPGTALVLLMAGPAANFASFTLISREMGRKSTILYLASIIIGAIAFGLAIDYLLPAEWFSLANMQAVAAHRHGVDWFPTLCSIFLVVLLVVAFLKGHTHAAATSSPKAREYTIKGMNCSHCRAAVMKSIEAVEGVTQVSVDLATGKAFVEGGQKDEDVIAAVRKAGFDVEE